MGCVVALHIRGYFFKVYFIALLTVLFLIFRIEKMSLVHQEGGAQKRQKQVENLLAFFYIIFSPEEFSLKWERG